MELPVKTEDLFTINTSCRDCHFAIYEGNTQTGCRMGRIEPLLKQNALVRVEEEQLHEGEEVKNYYDMINRVCLAYTDKALNQTITPEEMREKLRIKLQVLIMVSNGDNLDDVKRTFLSLKNQTIKPTVIHIVHNSDTVTPYAINDFLKTVEDQEWRMRYITARTKDKCRLKSSECVDFVLNDITKKDCSFYSVFQAGFVVPESFVQDIDSAINERMERFFVLLPTGRYSVYENGLTVLVNAHKTFNGNIQAQHTLADDSTITVNTIEEKLELVAKDHNLPQFIRNVTEICPSLA